LRDPPREDRTYAAGEISGMIHDVRPVRDLIDGIIKDAAALSAKLFAVSTSGASTVDRLRREHGA
jgi:hypothetical protein